MKKISRLKLKHQILLIFLFPVIIFAVMEFYFYYSFFNLTQERAANYGNKSLNKRARR
ncbi:hypothetical protein [Paenibacillus sonchi]|uniref:hypothetical protein n=1 Tax=Paenibacillus sonchi TaxID=373687 RepID=UPI000319D801|nr:hypothetical protein [Paenibacillus sonchi]